MVERRKRFSTTLGKSKQGPVESASRIKLDNELRWNWIGSDVSRSNEITLTHRIRAAGLEQCDGRRACRNIYSRKVANGFSAMCISDATEDLITIDSDEEFDSSCTKKLCKDNPFCLNYLGQELWEDEEKAKEAFYNANFKDNDPTINSRLDLPVGLRNLGATCYANAFLQVWFRDLAFRAGVYRCRATTDAQQRFQESPIFQLQVTFAALQGSQESIFNPKKLVESLQLRTFEQQDAQEFSKLFMTHLAEEFKKQDSEELRSLLSNQFEGEMLYATVCKNCGCRSERSATFLELEINLKRNCTLQDRLEATLEPEELKEDNKYLCSICESLQDATRYTELRRLPPVLHISILRFVYDIATYERKKSKLPLKFPPFLDMRPFIQSKSSNLTEDDTLYELRGVLLHKGTSAYHGHYEAQVYDELEDNWYQFNDEDVSQLMSFHHLAAGDSGKPIVLSDDEDSKSLRANAGGSDEKLKLAGKASSPIVQTLLSSKDAYMLVYGRRSERNKTPMSDLTPPLDACSVITEANEVHRQACDTYRLREEEKTHEFETIRKAFRDVYTSWKSSDPSSCTPDDYIVSKAALQEWLKSPMNGEQADSRTPTLTAIAGKNEEKIEVTALSEGGVDNVKVVPSTLQSSSRDRQCLISGIINNSGLLCRHWVEGVGARVIFNPMLDKELKVLSQSSRDRLLSSGVRLAPELRIRDICESCIREEFSERMYQQEHPEIVEEFNKVCNPETDEEGCWISKTWLKEWISKKPSFHQFGLPDPPPDSEGHRGVNYLRHVKCEHGNVGLESSTRRLISSEGVAILCSLFPEWNPPGWNDEECATCDVGRHIMREHKLEIERRISGEKAQLSRIATEKRFDLIMTLADGPCVIVPSQFIQDWKNWIENGGETSRPARIGTREFICDHGSLIIDLLDPSALDGSIAIISVEEWSTLLTLYPSEPPITVRRTQDDHNGTLAELRIESDLHFCKSCSEHYMMDFADADLTVIHLRVHEPIPTSTSSSKPCESRSNREGRPAEERREASSSKQSTDRKRKTYHEPTHHPMFFPTLNKNGVRQSRRLKESNKSRRDVMKIHKDTSVGEIREWAHDTFSVPKYLVNLYYNGSLLLKDEKTVADIGIRRKDTVYMKQLMDDAISIDSDSDDGTHRNEMKAVKKRRDEGEAFKGTLLGGGSFQSSPPKEPPPSSPISSETKSCPACTLINAQDAVTCDACGLPL